tara:strand:+ start:529 stop:861 length:333 start_codon:yes stop_codon:yes gene_type:complete
MAAFIINPIKKVSSCPCMSKNIYVEKEIVVGTSMALATILLTGHHHHITTLKDIQNTVTYETINTVNNIYFDKESLLSKLVRRKKKIAIFLILLPFLFRYISFTGTELVI